MKLDDEVFFEATGIIQPIVKGNLISNILRDFTAHFKQSGSSLRYFAFPPNKSPHKLSGCDVHHHLLLNFAQHVGRTDQILDIRL
ncbi:hypothetical protein ETAA8_20060 [Anatilimnocola aggregata]|uniref:Uncharacterized protein n=1 Tax=Anatilimnocola aggregata TaxID=2528021 RepID=A0A517Y9T5_9BACT|nr:hypothetical protein ETAA8_20060 [Anatilimnocola aggregata]